MRPIVWMAVAVVAALAVAAGSFAAGTRSSDRWVHAGQIQCLISAAKPFSNDGHVVCGREDQAGYILGISVSGRVTVFQLQALPSLKVIARKSIRTRR